MLLDIVHNILFIAVLYVGLPFAIIALVVWATGRLRRHR